MSLYNMLFGMNPAADVLLAMLGKTRDDFGRFRDCYPNDDGTQIIVHTRCGGGNRDDYEGVFDEMQAHPNYLSDADDDFDCTYADIVFSVPEPFAESVKAIADQTDTRPPAEKWEKLLTDMRENKDNPAVSRALEVGGRIFGAITEGKSGPVSTPDGSVNVITPNPADGGTNSPR